VAVDLPVTQVGRLRHAAQASALPDAPVGEDGAALGDMPEDDGLETAAPRRPETHDPDHTTSTQQAA
jgi:hypothetical protein